MDGSYNLPSNVWSLEKLLKDCDYICNVLPKTPQTNNILGKGKLEFCKGIYMFDLLIANCQSKIFAMLSHSDFWLWSIFRVSGKEFGTVFINIGRSNVIKEAELLEAIQKGWIREAVLDVFDQGKIKFSQKYLLQVLKCIYLVIRILYYY